MNLHSNRTCLLVDNGSIRSEAVLFSRMIAQQLEETSGLRVIATSLAHSDRINPNELNGNPAKLFKPTLENLLQTHGEKRIIVLPLLLIQGGAIYQRIVNTAKELKAEFPTSQITVSEALISCTDPLEHSIHGLMAKSIQKKLGELDLSAPEVIVVDHGSPNPTSGETRDWIVTQIKASIPTTFDCNIQAASMERREGAAYDFNDPLLQNALETLAKNNLRDVLVAKLFLQPGKHSGKRGDIDTIINNVSQRFPEFNIHILENAIPQPGLVDILLNRLQASA